MSPKDKKILDEIHNPELYEHIADLQFSNGATYYYVRNVFFAFISLYYRKDEFRHPKPFVAITFTDTFPKQIWLLMDFPSILQSAWQLLEGKSWDNYNR